MWFKDNLYKKICFYDFFVDTVTFEKFCMKFSRENMKKDAESSKIEDQSLDEGLFQLKGVGFFEISICDFFVWPCIKKLEWIDSFIIEKSLQMRRKLYYVIL